MPVAEARAVLAPVNSRSSRKNVTVRWDQDDPAADRQSLQAVANFCQRFSPIVGLEEADSPESLFLELTGCAHLFGSETDLVQALSKELAAQSYLTRMALAETPGAAWAVAHFSPVSNMLFDVRPAAHRLDSLPVAALRLPPAVVPLLNTLGIVTCGQVLALPRESLPSRFGRDVIRRLQQALGEIPEAIVPERLSQPLQAAWETDWPVTDQRGIETVFAHLLDQLHREHLAPRRAGVLDLACTLQVDTATVSIDLKLSRPTANISHLCQLFQLRCERQAWPGSVRKIGLEFRQIAPLSERQHQLFEDETELTHREIAGLIDRLTSRLGCDAVAQTRDQFDPLPERAWSWEPWGSPVSESAPAAQRQDRRARHRPLRLFPQPQPIVVCATSREGVPQQLQRNGRLETVHRAWGPERIAAGWWRKHDECRDYYRIETNGGIHLWIYRRHRPEAWFLHGYFC